MYCPQCKIDIPEADRLQCPLCGGMLIAPSKKRREQTADNDQRLKELIADVKRSLEDLPGEADTGAAAPDAQPPAPEHYSLDAADEAVFSIDLAQADAPETGLADEQGEDSLNRFDLERELNLTADKSEIISREESLEITGAEHAPAAAQDSAAMTAQQAQREVAPDHLQQVIRGLEKAGAPQQITRPRRKQGYVLPAMFVLGSALIGIFFATGGKDLLKNILNQTQSVQKVTHPGSAPAGEQQQPSSLQLPAGDAPAGAPDQAPAALEQPAAGSESPPHHQAEQPPLGAAAAPGEQPAAPEAPAQQQPALTEPQPGTAADNATAVRNVPQPAPEAAVETLENNSGTADLQHRGSGQPAVLYTIHTDSYRKEQSALREAARLRKLGIAAFVQTLHLKEKGLWYRVMIGKFPGLEDARKMLNELQQTHKKTDARITTIEE
jgi:hypothetical protein